MKAPIALALDTTDLDRVSAWTRAASPHISTVKVGLELFLRHGGAVIERVRDIAPDIEIFLDLKLHDIPNTVAGATRSVVHHRPKFLTVHALGGAEMISAAASAAPEIKIAAVTILTSHTQDQLATLGIAGSLRERVLSLARMSVDAGAQAIVCSPHEAADLRAELGPGVDLITPGVRPTGSDSGDQKRIATPEAAIEAGATLLVIGRPITGAYERDGESGVAAAALALADAVQAARSR